MKSQKLKIEPGQSTNNISTKLELITDEDIFFLLDKISNKLYCGDITLNSTLQKNIIENTPFQNKRHEELVGLEYKIEYKLYTPHINKEIHSDKRYYQEQYSENFVFDNSDYNYSYVINSKKQLKCSKYLFKVEYAISFSCCYKLNNTDQPYIDCTPGFYNFVKSSIYFLTIFNNLSLAKIKQEVDKYVYSNPNITQIIMQYVNIVYCIDTFIKRVELIKQLTETPIVKKNSNIEYKELTLYELKTKIAKYEAEINGTDVQKEYDKFQNIQNTEDPSDSLYTVREIELKRNLLEQYGIYGLKVEYNKTALSALSKQDYDIKDGMAYLKYEHFNGYDHIHLLYICHDYSQFEYKN